MENWALIKEFPEYRVSDRGRVRKDGDRGFLQHHINQREIVYVSLRAAGFQYNRSVAKLVAEAFLQKPNENFDSVINMDGDRSNVEVSNLLWRPRWFAYQYHRQFNHNKIHSPKKIVDLDTGMVFDNSYECAIACGLLEAEIIINIMNNEKMWPTGQHLAFV